MHFSLHKIMLNSCCFILLLFDLMDAVISIHPTYSIPDHSKAGVSRRGTGKVQFAPMMHHTLPVQFSATPSLQDKTQKALSFPSGRFPVAFSSF